MCTSYVVQKLNLNKREVFFSFHLEVNRSVAVTVREGERQGEWDATKAPWPESKQPCWHHITALSHLSVGDLLISVCLENRQGTATSFTLIYICITRLFCNTTSTEKLESVHFALNSSLSSFALYPSSKQSSPGAFQLSLSVTQLDRLHLNPPMHSALFSLDKRIMHFSYCMDIRECLSLNQSLSTMQTEHFLLIKLKICHQLQQHQHNP